MSCERHLNRAWEGVCGPSHERSDRSKGSKKPTRESASVDICASLRSTVSGVFQIGRVHDRNRILDSGEEVRYVNTKQLKSSPPPSPQRALGGLCARHPSLPLSMLM